MRLPKRSPHFRLTRGPSWIWKSRKAVSQRRSSPTSLFSRAERYVETSVDVIESTITSSFESGIWDFSPMRSRTGDIAGLIPAPTCRDKVLARRARDYLSSRAGEWPQSLSEEGTSESTAQPCAAHHERLTIQSATACNAFAP